VLQRYSWPGNVRELRNLVERLMIMVPGDRVTERDVTFLDSEVGGVPQPPAPDTTTTMPLLAARDQFERDYILRALAAQHGNISRTSDVLGVERSNLYRKMRGFGIIPRAGESGRSGEVEEVEK